jgi:probable HAF family extracellular repeat protein
VKIALSHGFRWFLLACGAGLASPALAIYVFNTVEYPGAVYTDVRGVNNSGQLVGYANFDGTTNFSFTYSGGVFTPLTASPLQPSALGLNDGGTVVGGTITTPEQAYIYSGGSYGFFSRPTWTHSEARAVNNAGRVAGWSYELDGVGGYSASAGFIYDPASHSFTDIPIAGSTFTIAQGINAAGQVVGSARVASGEQAFLRQPGGSITMFTVAGSPTRARGINDLGLITGFVTSGAAIHGFVGDSLGYELLDMPGAAGTYGEGINNAGQVSGVWYDATDNAHGFIATPAAMPTGTTSGGAYTFAVDVVPNVPIFIDPKVAVGYDYAIGKKDPRIASVQFPIGVGDNYYVLKVDGRKFVVAGGEWFDFRAHGWRKGVADFRVGCIDTSAMLDPANAQAFPTGLTFVAAGRFTGTQKPRTRKSTARLGPACRMDDNLGEDDD